MSKLAVKRLGFGLLLFGIGVATGSKFNVPTWFTVVFPSLSIAWLMIWDNIQTRDRNREYRRQLSESEVEL